MSTDSNKQRLVSDELRKRGCTVVNAPGDADVIIVKAAVEKSLWKKTAFQKLLKGDSDLRSCANAFILPNQTTAVIDELGCQAMAVLFGGNGTDSLATMRYNTFSRKVVTSSSFVTPDIASASNRICY